MGEFAEALSHAGALLNAFDRDLVEVVALSLGVSIAAVAIAWALSAQVLFLDEPTANLDPSTTHAVEALIGAINAAGAKIVMTTHDMAQARRIADEVLFIHQGRLLEQTPAAQFFDAPATPQAAAFLAGELLW